MKIYYAIQDGMHFGTPTESLVTFVEHKRTKKPLYSGGGNLHFVRLVELNEVNRKISGLFDKIKHGDEEHQAWLKKAIEDYFNG